MAAAIERLHALYDAGHLSEFWAYLNRLLERGGAMPTQESASGREIIKLYYAVHQGGSELGRDDCMCRPCLKVRAMRIREAAQDPDAETGTADDRITAEQIAVLRKYLDNMEKRHLRDAAKGIEGVSVNELLARVLPSIVDEERFQGWLEVRRRLDRLEKIAVAARALLPHMWEADLENTAESDFERDLVAFRAVLEGR